jgi:hypothetical protein
MSFGALHSEIPWIIKKFRKNVSEKKSFFQSNHFKIRFSLEIILDLVLAT